MRLARSAGGAIFWTVTILGIAFAAVPVLAGDGKVEYITVHSPALEDNLLKDSADRPVAVYLPPGYSDSPNKRYPVIYLLHGFGDSHTQWFNGPNGESIAKWIDALVAEKTIVEMIVVMPNANNAYGGSFYTDSPVTGNWETFTAHDLPRHVDTHYRTLAQASSRGLAGHSMGGYGSIKVAMKHPDMFCAVFAMNPACLGWAADLSPRNPAFVTVTKLKTRQEAAAAGVYPIGIIAAGAAFSPNTKRPPFLIDVPFELRDNELQPVEGAYQKWTDNLPVYMVERYAKNLRQLKALHFETGVVDDFTHIPPSCAMLSEALTRHRVPHVFEIYEGDHRNRIAGENSRIKTKMLPYFSANLAVEVAPSAN